MIRSIVNAAWTWPTPRNGFIGALFVITTCAVASKSVMSYGPVSIDTPMNGSTSVRRWRYAPVLVTQRSRIASTRPSPS